MSFESGRRVYLDYQASTPVDPRVTEAMAPHLFDHPANPHSTAHAFGLEAGAAVERAAEKIAAALGADTDEIVLTSGATEANNHAILGAAVRASEGRRRILVSAIEHKCVLESAAIAARRSGFIVERIPVDAEGRIRLDVLREMLADDVLLVSVMTVNNEIGAIEPLREVSELCRRVGALVHTDAAQALAACDLPVDGLGVDLLSLTGHKIYGPKGIGILYIRRDVQDRIEPLIHGGGQQRGLRAGTLPVPLCVGLGEAVALITGDEAGEERVRIGGLRDRLVEGICECIPGVQLNGPSGDARHPGNANLRFPGVVGHRLLARLQPMLAASTAAACASGAQEPSHVLTAIGLEAREAESSVRFSVGRFTLDDDISAAVEMLRQALAPALSVGSQR